ncbi:MAG TPA: MFS transporter [Gemmataceae bacterium]|nr:MFS transporter [Gemmataceae bacterium]
MTGLQTLTAATIGGALIFGMTLALLGRLKLALAQRVHLGEGQLRRLLLALNIALIPLVLLSGILLDIYGARLILVAGSAMLAVSLVGLSLRPTYPHAFASILLAGFGASALGTACTVLMPHAFYSAEETSASLNLGYVFIALGALLTPVLADILLAKIELRRTLAVFSLLALTPAFLGVLPSNEYWHIADHPGNLSTFLAEPTGWLAALMLFFYAPLEAAISLWTFTLLAERDQDEREATGLLSGFWAAFIASRLLVALARHMDLLTEGWDTILIIVPPMLAAVLLGNLAGASPHARPRSGLILLGLLLGPVLPTLLGLVFRYVAPAEQGTAYGFAFAAGSLGSVLFAPLIDLRARPPLQTALRLPIFLAVLVMVLALVLGLIMP